MKIAVVGSNGQLGVEIMRCIPIDKIGQYKFFSHADLDITNKDEVFSKMNEYSPDVIVNCAAYTNVDKASGEGKELARKVNVDGASNLANVCNELNATLIHISTDYVFNGKKNIAYKENDDVNPLNVYGMTKLFGEDVISVTKCKCIIIRTSWLYSSHHKNFFLTIKRLLEDGKDLKVISDQIGTPTWAKDLANAIIGIINDNHLDKTGVYHYSNEGVASWFDFACSIREYLGKDNKITPCYSEDYESSVDRPKFSVLDKSLFKNTFKQEIPYWRSSLLECIKEVK